MDYAVAVKNTGTSTIWVDTFEIYQGGKPKGKVGVGILPPAIAKTSQSYSKEPNQQVDLTWRNEKTGEKYSTEVVLKVPKSFWGPLTHHKIIIYLNPDTKMVKVGYYGYSIKEDKEYYINSKGEVYVP
jgi:hypothetical protein